MSKDVLRYKAEYKSCYKAGGEDKPRKNNEFALLSFRPVTDGRTKSGAVATPHFPPFRGKMRPCGFPVVQVATAPQNHVPESVRHGFLLTISAPYNGPKLSTRRKAQWL